MGARVDLTAPVTARHLAPGTPLLVVMPVYGGRLPAIAVQRLREIRGNDSPAIAVVVYGNRAYDDALLELRDILTANGFKVVAAAAFIAGLIVYIGQDKLATIVPTEYANWIPIIVLVAGYILAQTTENKRVDVAEQIVREEYTDPTAEEDDDLVVGDDTDDDGC